MDHQVKKLKKLKHLSYAVTSRSLEIWDIKVKRAVWGVSED